MVARIVTDPAAEHASLSHLYSPTLLSCSVPETTGCQSIEYKIISGLETTGFVNEKSVIVLPALMSEKMHFL